MNPHKFKLLFLGFTTILLFGYACFFYWLPNYVDESSTLNIPLEQRISTIKSAIEHLDNTEKIDRASLKKVFELQINSEIATEDSFTSVKNTYIPFAENWIYLLTIHFSALYMFYRSLVAKKT
ncbi:MULTISPECIES: hypothetical protein [unclassified Colwellia]|uniref:hypothetical protein n=1 Tax=unclassified Colwellia TaxID=196834 RepID=UPI0015F537E5|nr:MULTISPECIES: hypothetical protein [unclassified Colwellia]MBA6234507.1 hypothetical protein [Colwellia sp. MB02u-7]MBA6238326.1 hypothetical protein [Colwellia sp. MB02u-11]MBA6301069.1 hypothetical protein [Colwellia sp. MB3u-22]MBA6312610.1 hypothetical protein [Colwellia sp. MB3u-64]